ncbi:hypothetical protein QQP08_015527, partial [Theobroma cacao]
MNRRSRENQPSETKPPICKAQAQPVDINSPPGRVTEIKGPFNIPFLPPRHRRSSLSIYIFSSSSSSVDRDPLSSFPNKPKRDGCGMVNLENYDTNFQ